jgi:hypothetical protein
MKLKIIFHQIYIMNLKQNIKYYHQILYSNNNTEISNTIQKLIYIVTKINEIIMKK